MKPVPRSFRRHALGLFGTFAGVMLVFTLVNTWINPIWVTPAPWTNDEFAEHRQIYRNLRTAKAGMARSVPWEVAMLGSSRVAIGLDPDIPQWGDTKVVNLGMSAASINENAAMLAFLIDNNPELKEVILGLDLTDLTSEDDLSRGAGFYESPLNENGDAFERELRYHVGFSTAEASYKTVKARASGFIPPYTTKGHWAHHRSVDPVRLILERDSVPFAVRYVRKRKLELALSDSKVASFRKAVRSCLENNIKLRLFIPPNHAVYLSVFPFDNDPDPFFMLDRRTIVDLVAEEQKNFPNAPEVVIWDFNDFHPLNCEPIPENPETPAKYWVDGTHSLETLGNVILSRINDWPLDDPVEASYGQILTPENIDQREEIIRKSYEKYQIDHPEDWQFTKNIMKEFSPTDAEPVETFEPSP
ncbi:hypothetical protein [Haloferula sp.]|uniref:hypothetical protein n=1 Tax=Haloferula sp. TaxID=2497595 RepID=UPI003C7905F4